MMLLPTQVGEAQTRIRARDKEGRNVMHAGYLIEPLPGLQIMR